MATLPRAISDLVGVFERLPGIGPKSATRLAFYLLNTPISFVEEIAGDLARLKSEIMICGECFGVSESNVCGICRDSKRKTNLICVVERAIDVVALENVGNYGGIYHVLNGVINPLNHIGPEDLKIDELLSRLSKIDGPVEVILATNLTMEGEATALYIRKKIEVLGKHGLKISRIGSGLPIGSDMEYADMATLSRAMEGRTEL
ncbi:recombination protein RecR [Candidatus Shapirobacteria bacterium]|nr:recombination protein RecR [Candidatus Shapirobacteria bacterium]